MLRKSPMPPNQPHSAWASPSCHDVLHSSTGMSLCRVCRADACALSAQMHKGTTYQTPAMLESQAKEDMGKWPGLFPITVQQEQEGFSGRWTRWGLVFWGEAARGGSVITHSAYLEAKALLARSCGYLLWHKIQIILFVLGHEQNLT